MTNSFYGIGYASSSFFDSYFGTSYSSNTFSSSPLTSSLGDLQMINSGVYKKALKSYYAAQKANSDKESVSASGTADSNISLSTLKSAAKSLNTSALKLQNTDYETVDREELLKDVKSFASSYNSTLNATKKMNSYSILQTAVWATEQMNIGEGLLNKVGISIKDDNTLEIDEEKFKEAKNSDLKALFSGSGSLASRIAQKASNLANQSANQMAVNLGKNLYTSYATLLG